MERLKIINTGGPPPRGSKKVIVPLTSNELIVQSVLRNWFQDPTGFNNVGTRDFKRAVQALEVLNEER